MRRDEKYNGEMNSQLLDSGNQIHYNKLSRPMRFRTSVGTHLRWYERTVCLVKGALTVETVHLSDLSAFVVPSQ